MAIIDRIFKNISSAHSSMPKDSREMVEEATRVPNIPEAKASDVEDKQPAEVVNTQQEATSTPNKWGYSDSDVSYLGKMGYTPERLEQIANFDPSKGNNFLQHLYESTVSKPTEPDEKKLKNARLWSGIADGVGMLSQMWSAGKGAHMRERDYSDSAISKIAKKEQEIRDKYTKASQMYDNGRLQARMKDYLKALEDHNNDRKGVQGALATKQKIEEQARQFEEKQRLAYDKMGQDQANRDRDYELRKQNQEGLDKQRDAMVKQGWARLADANNRTTAYVKKMSSGSGANKNYQMIFAANPNDKEAVKDNQLGANVRVFEMSKGEIDRYAREALQDNGFKDRHPHLTVKSKGLLGNDTERLRPNEDIAAAWIEEQYSKSFTQAPALPPMATPPYMDWKQTIQPNWMPNYLPNYTTPSDNEEINYPEDGDEDEDFPIVGSMNVATF